MKVNQTVIFICTEVVALARRAHLGGVYYALLTRSQFSEVFRSRRRFGLRRCDRMLPVSKIVLIIESSSLSLDAILLQLVAVDILSSLVKLRSTRFAAQQVAQQNARN